MNATSHLREIAMADVLFQKSQVLLIDRLKLMIRRVLVDRPSTLDESPVQRPASLRVERASYAEVHIAASNGDGMDVRLRVCIRHVCRVLNRRLDALTLVAGAKEYQVA